MSKNFSIAYQAPPIGLLPPAADAAGRTGPYKSLRNVAGKVAVVCRVNQGNAAPVTFSVLQSKDSSGTGSKAIGTLSNPQIFYNADTTSSDTLVGQVAATNFATDAALKDKIVIFDFDPASCLDLANSYSHIAVQTSASNASNITAAEMIAMATFQQTVPPPSEV
jgi:hypothetical protein